MVLMLFSVVVLEWNHDDDLELMTGSVIDLDQQRRQHSVPIERERSIHSEGKPFLV